MSLKLFSAINKFKVQLKNVNKRILYMMRTPKICIE
jgi:hypothetical protein